MSESKEKLPEVKTSAPKEKLPVTGLYKEVIPDLVYRITFWDGLEHSPVNDEGHLHTIVIGEDAAGNVRGRAGEHVVFKGWGIIEIEQGKDNWVVVGVGPKDEVLARYEPLVTTPKPGKKSPELESGDQNLKVKL